MKPTNIELLEVSGNCATIIIEKLYIVIVDKEDLSEIMQYKWYTDKTKIKNHGLYYFKARMPDSRYIYA